MAAPNYTLRNTCFVSKFGTDDAGYNAVGAPQARLTIAAALADLAANYPAATPAAPHLVCLEPGVYVTPGFALPPNTFIGMAEDAGTNPAKVAVIELTGNITLAAAWSANATAIGGLSNCTIQESTTAHIDFTMPAPVAGNPLRMLEVLNVRWALEQLVFEATGTGDVISVQGCQQNGDQSADTIELYGGTQLVRDTVSVAQLYLGDGNGIATNGQVYGYANAGLDPGNFGIWARSLTTASQWRLGNCDLRTLFISANAPGSITVYADAPSIPLAADLSFGGIASNSDLIRTTDSGAIAGGGGSGGNNYDTFANNAGDTTISPDQPNFYVKGTVGGVARTSNIAIDLARPAAAGDMVTLLIDLPATTAIVLNIRNATVAGTILASFTTDGKTRSWYVVLAFDGAAWQLQGTGSGLANIESISSAGGNLIVSGGGAFAVTHTSTGPAGVPMLEMYYDSGLGACVINAINRGIANLELRLQQAAGDVVIPSGSIKTGNPSGGAAAAWRMGDYTAALAVPTGKIRIQVGAAKYDIAAELVP